MLTRCAESGAITIRNGEVRGSYAPPGWPPMMFATGSARDGYDLVVTVRMPYRDEWRRNFMACSGGERCE